LIRRLVPAQSDNEQAAEYLRQNIGQNHPYIEWVVIRPDTLTHEKKVSKYMIHPSPIRSAILNPGKTSRINVAHFMASLLASTIFWMRWKGKMPVVYNQEDK